jgi:phage terminase large subunit GpA-like protein
MTTYKGVSSSDKQKIINALKARGAGSCPRCDDSQWTVSEYSRIDVQETSARESHGGATIPAVMIVCQHCGFIAQHALQPLGLWNHTVMMSHGTTAAERDAVS